MANDVPTTRKGETASPSKTTSGADASSQTDRSGAVTNAISNAAPMEPPAPNNRDLADLPRNDLGNAYRLIKRHGHDLMFVDAAGWYDWDRRRWRESPAKHTPEAQKRAHQTAESIADEARALQAELDQDIVAGRLDPGNSRHAQTIGERQERIATHYKFGLSSGNSGRLSAMLNEAAPYLRHAQNELDPDPFLLNLANGTLVLGSIGAEGAVSIELRPHDRRDLITRFSPIEYDPEAIAVEFQKFLEQIQPNPKIRLFLQVWFGYCLTGDVGEQVMVLFHGTGANGKSTLLKLMAAVFGDYAVTSSIQTFLTDDRRGSGDATPDLARLPGARLVLASEPERGSRLSEAVVKTVTGGEKMVARRLFEGQFEFDPLFKLTLSANEKPRISGQDEGIWRRVVVVPFEMFVPRKLRNRRLFNRLLDELPGILNWLLDGYRIWREQGLQIPSELLTATDQYRAESDPVGEFLRVCTQPTHHVQLRAKDLYDVYCLWCRRNAMDPVSTNMFGRRLSDRNIHKETVQVVYYTLEFTDEGIRLFEELRRKLSKDPADNTPRDLGGGNDDK